MKIAVIIPCYKVTEHIVGVLDAIGGEVSAIYCVDDACPVGSGAHISKYISDKRVQILYHEENQGVGAAVMTGYKQAITEGMDILVKVDGDGQMDPVLIEKFIAPIQESRADYTKGNRFYSLELSQDMPWVRKVGNFGLSFFCKLSSGYWNVFDPTNGYTAISAKVAAELPFDKIATRYFFESDLLFRLYTFRAVVWDIPMKAKYGNEKSNLSVSSSLFSFFARHVVNTGKRLFYTYFLRDFSIASLELFFGVLLLLSGLWFGGHQWSDSVRSGIEASAGTVMLAALPIIIGFQLLLSFLNYDMNNVPRRAKHPML